MEILQEYAHVEFIFGLGKDCKFYALSNMPLPVPEEFESSLALAARLSQNGASGKFLYQIEFNRSPRSSASRSIPVRRITL